MVVLSSICCRDLSGTAEREKENLDQAPAFRFGKKPPFVDDTGDIEGMISTVPSLNGKLLLDSATTSDCPVIVTASMRYGSRKFWPLWQPSQ